MKCQGKWAWAGGIHFKQLLCHQNPWSWNRAEKLAVLQEGLLQRSLCMWLSWEMGRKEAPELGGMQQGTLPGQRCHGSWLLSVFLSSSFWMGMSSGVLLSFHCGFLSGSIWGKCRGKNSSVHTFRDQKESYLILMKTPLSISWTLSHGQGLARIWDYLPWGDGCVFCAGIREPRVPKEVKIIVDQPKSHTPPTFHNFPGNWVEAPDMCCQVMGRGRKGSGRVRKSQWDSAMSLFPRHWPWVFQGSDHEATRCMPLRKGETTLKFFNKDTFFHVKSRDKV